MYINVTIIIQLDLVMVFITLTELNQHGQPLKKIAGFHGGAHGSAEHIQVSINCGIWRLKIAQCHSKKKSRNC